MENKNAASVPMKIGIASLDAQHEALFECINKFIRLYLKGEPERGEVEKQFAALVVIDTKMLIATHKTLIATAPEAGSGSAIDGNPEIVLLPFGRVDYLEIRKEGKSVAVTMTFLHKHVHLFAEIFQKPVHCKRRSDAIAVGIDVHKNRDGFDCVNFFGKALVHA